MGGGKVSEQGREEREISGKIRDQDRFFPFP